MSKINPASIGNSKHAQGAYRVKNPQKYLGNSTPLYRSSWELDFCQTCDDCPAITGWCVEPFAIKYVCPLTNRLRDYWPDFMIQYKHKDGTIKTELIEIKPAKLATNAKTKKEKMILAVNMAKWAAAKEFCARNNIEFRVMTENELYVTGRNK